MVSLVAIGHPVMDLTARVDEDLLAREGITKGGWELVGEEEGRQLLDLFKPELASSGGSAANVACAYAKRGGRASFVGGVGDDAFGRAYADQLVVTGIEPLLSILPGATAYALTLITPDGERTFRTHLGAAERYSYQELNAVLPVIMNADSTHVEGYQFRVEHQQTMAYSALRAAKRARRKCSLDFSAVEIVTAHRDSLEKIIFFCDVVFANEAEAHALTGKPAPEAAELLGENSLAVVKLGAQGMIVYDGILKQLHEVPSFPVKAVNTNGAGDVVAGTFLNAIDRGFTPLAAGAHASIYAAESCLHDRARVQ